jgi:hypothetical protein
LIRVYEVDKRLNINLVNLINRLEFLRLQQHVAHVAEGEDGQDEKRYHIFSKKLMVLKNSQNDEAPAASRMMVSIFGCFF